jgi:hypothetical protein
MSQTIVNRLTGETLSVYLDLGDDLWLCNEAGDIEHAQRAHFPLERWRFDGARDAGDNIPRVAIRIDFPALPVFAGAAQ